MENHRSSNGSMFIGFLDGSKTVDALNNSLLFKKLIDRKELGCIIRMMIYCYASQTMYECWSRVLSHGFNVANGVCIFTYLMYTIDDLSIVLYAYHTGCCVNNTIMNHFIDMRTT